MPTLNPRKIPYSRKPSYLILHPQLRLKPLALKSAFVGVSETSNLHSSTLVDYILTPASETSPLCKRIDLFIRISFPICAYICTDILVSFSIYNLLQSLSFEASASGYASAFKTSFHTYPTSNLYWKALWVPTN